MPDYCHITGTIYRVGQEGETPEVAKNVPLTITPISVAGLAIASAYIEVRTDSDGNIDFRLIQGARVNISGDVSGYNMSGGREVDVPDEDEAAFESLLSNTSYPAQGLTIYNESSLLPGYYSTVYFLGAGISAARISAGVLGVTVSGSSGGGDSIWGAIEGDLPDQADLQEALDGKQNALGFTPVTNARAIGTTAPLAGGGDLSANRTFSIPKATGLIDGYLAASDFEIFTGKQNALDYTPENPANKNQANGYVGLDSSSKINPSYLPAIAISSFLGSVASQAAMLALAGQEGDWAIRTDTGTTWIIVGSDPAQLSGWQQLSTPTDLVSSVFGRTGPVTAQANDYTFAQIGSKPTTLAGYGITDAQPLSSRLNELASIGSALQQPRVNAAGNAYEWFTPSAGSGYTNLFQNSNVLEQRNGASAQEFDLFKTYTDASNYEKGFLKWNGSILELGTTAAGTGDPDRTVRIKAGGQTYNFDPFGNMSGIGNLDLANSRFGFSSSGMALGNAIAINWYDSTQVFGSNDLTLKRIAPAVFGLTDGSSGGAAIQLKPKASTPADPSINSEINFYNRSAKVVHQYNDAGVVKYLVCDMTQAAGPAVWAVTTSAP